MKYTELESLYALADQMNDIFVIFDYDGKILDVNSRFINLFATKKEKVVGISLFSIVVEDRRDEAHKLFERVRKGTNCKCNIPFKNENGGIVHVETFVDNFLYENKKIYYMYAKDVTDIVNERLKFEYLFFNNPMPMSISKMDSGELIMINDKFSEFTGYSRKEVLGKTTVDLGFYSQEARENFIEEFRKNNGKLDNWEMDIKLKGGKDAKGVLNLETINLNNEKNILAIFNDLTETRKKLLTTQNTLSQQKLLAETTIQLNQDQNISQTFNDILAKIGKFTESDRAYIFEDIDDIATKNTYEWCGEGVTPQINNLQNVPYADVPGMKRTFRNSGMLKCSDISKLSEDLIIILQPQGIQSILILPLIINNKQIGFVGFDQVKKMREWSESEVTLLQIIASSISNALERQRSLAQITNSLIQNKLTSKIAEIGNSTLDYQLIMNKIFNLLIEEEGLCGVYIYSLNEQKYLFEAHKNALQHFVYDGPDVPENEILGYLRPDGLVIDSEKIVDQKILELLNPFKTRSVLVFPLEDVQDQSMFIGYMQCTSLGQWKEAELNMYKTVTQIINNIVYKELEKENIIEKISENANTKSAMLNILEDIENERQKSQELVGELTKFQLAVSQASDHIVITDNRGKIIFANTAAEKITGYAFEEMYGRTPGELWGELMSKNFYKNFWHEISSDKEVFKGEFLNRRKNGEEYYAMASVTPIMDNEKRIMFFVGLERDITKEKEVDKMKTEFISLASHQLRTPLAAAKWYLEMLMSGDVGKLTDQQMDFIENIDIFNKRMIDLVDALLNISRIESGRIIIEPHPTSVKDLVEGVFDELEIKLVEGKKKINKIIQKGIPLVNLDLKMIRNALINLITNAIKYSPENTEIGVKVVKDDDYVVFEISDNGYGIPEKEQDRVFSKFFRSQNIVKKDTDGNGLGLYLVKSIIESSGGQIWFESEENKGTTFWFKIPIKGIKTKQGEVSIN